MVRPERAPMDVNEHLTLLRAAKQQCGLDGYFGRRSFIRQGHNPRVSDKVPLQLLRWGDAERLTWLWSWAFAIPKASKNPEAAEKFALGGTSKPYIKLAC